MRPRRARRSERLSAADKLHKDAQDAAQRTLDIELTGNMAVDAPNLIAALKGDGVVFQYLDEKPGFFPAFNRERHSVMHEVRNSPVWGQKLFESFR